MDATSFSAYDNTTLSGIQYNIIIAWFKNVPGNSQKRLNSKNLIHAYIHWSVDQSE